MEWRMECNMGWSMGWSMGWGMGWSMGWSMGWGMGWSMGWSMGWGVQTDAVLLPLRSQTPALSADALPPCRAWTRRQRTCHSLYSWSRLSQSLLAKTVRAVMAYTAYLEIA